ncbi:sn-glycerol-3-phosphate ABC transporter ATP-binding protein UgpC [Vibrio plantisponsor]|jgi:multiple sugar transport system ATP-binding protein|uniref:Sn-glycerol-3-phosphate ABC transporter ATP-binding protein UgpC n=1 Tax=Vibrio plantisponsor TaxID=664643 RepID=A0ABU4IL47_9VIBR|nr:sn-glycerol-3-phosphate ABC transporter ATP-binding protein UgpC [Vibrio plantisponsor]MDW6019276.1 sn-glycerol-3-phosphate ABC transporter ATP-binding protein UgpC [Vibrio plantisponsor]NNM39396.1 sn-glycerol-3-phosphate ABC transporter ATP-binding protein UgpC [Vibrio plantisponsor]PNH90686.1 ABC transporter [Vibrio diazotrophicus]
MSSIQLSNVVKRFDQTQTIHNVNLSIEEGEFVVFVGPSGCGKSTLLRMIAGLEDISDGSISISGNIVNDVPPSERGVAMVFQSYALYPHMTVAENMGYSLKVNKIPKEEREKKVRLVGKALQLEHLLDRKPAQLSGGQRQRVAIGRAIVRDPKVFLFDEPLSNLDAELRVDMRLHIAKLHQELKSTMIYVTHDQVEAMTLADKIVVLRDGKVEQVGSPMDLYNNPINKFVAGFIGSPKMNFLPCRVEAWDQASLTIGFDVGGSVTLPIEIAPIEVGKKLTLGIRPEHLSTSLDTIELAFECEVVERLGGMTYVFGQCGGVDDFKYLHHGDTQVKPGESISLFTSPSHVHIFEPDGSVVKFDLVELAH